jgi:peptide/nickel transport system ATP-binding protein
MNGNTLFEVDGLAKRYPVRGESLLSSVLSGRQYLHAVDEVSFEITAGEIVGVAGQSGCGKSTLGDLLVGLEEPTAGDIHFGGDSLLEFSRSEMKEFRRRCQVIFQDPYETLNPRFTVSKLVSEPLVIHDIGDSETRDSRTMEALADAGLNPPEQYLDKVPGELSGGERQRVSIARALVLDPDFLLADEPVSMLDVSVRSGILNLFKELQRERDLTMMYISHDLSSINYLSDRTMIMYLGNLVEIGPTEQVIHDPSHPYTETLLNAVPSPDPDADRAGSDMESELQNAVDLPSGCRFAPNCAYATEECTASEPPLETHADGRDERAVACYHPVAGDED